MKQRTANLISCIGLVMIWYGAYFLTNGMGVPSLHATLYALQLNFKTIGLHLGVSLLRVMIANVIAISLGSFIGYFMAKSRFWNRLLSPSVYALLPVPKIAFLPLFLLIFGLQEQSRIYLLVFILLFQYITAAKDAMMALPDHQNNVIETLKLKPWIKFRYVIFPYYLPFLFTAIRQAIGVSLAVLFSIETFINQLGIGYYIMNRWSAINYPEMFAGIVVISLSGILIYRLLDRFERKVCPWK